MATKISIQIEPLVHGDTTVTNTGLVVKNLPAGEVFSVTKAVDRSLSAASLDYVRIFYYKGSTTTVNLKCSVTHADTGTLPSTPTIVTDSVADEYTLSGSTGQVNSLDITTTLTSFSSIDEGDIVGLGITRDSGDTGDFNIVRIEFEFNKDAGSGATAQTYDIITLAQAKEYLSIATAATDHDDFLQRWISYYSKEIEGPNGINNKVVVQDVAYEITNGTGRTKLRTLYYPIYALGVAASTTTALKLASLQYRDDVDEDWEDIEDDIDHIIINNPELSAVSAQNSYNFELWEDFYPDGIKNIRVSYQAGWSTVPADLVLVCLEKVADIYKQSSRGEARFGLQSHSFSEAGGSRNTTYRDLTARWNRMMEPFRRKY